MKYIFLSCIKIYWAFVPSRLKPKCIFSESCSHHVYRVFNDAGVWEGIKAFKKRFDQCRPGYIIIKNMYSGKIQVKLASGDVIAEELVALDIVQKFKEFEKDSLTYHDHLNYDK